ncbi:hypothetical protein NE656_25000, partial [Flavonifractor plautii]|nr:hypothetical protein [Flavonifractor plautii]
RAAQITEDSRYRDAAVHACQFIKQSMTDSRGRLYLRWRKGEAATPGQLDDYAVFGLALIELYRTTYEPQYLEDALHIAAQMTDLF